MANLPHVTAPPDLLPRNATGCCAGNKKRQRLKPQGATLQSWREQRSYAEEKKKFSGFPYARGGGVRGISHITTPPPPSLRPYLHRSLSSATSVAQLLRVHNLPMNSTVAGTNNPCPEGGSLSYPRGFSSLPL